MQEKIDAAVEKFSAVIREQLERIERIKAQGDFTDYAALDTIVIGICGGYQMLGESLSDPLRMYLSDIDTVPVNLAGLPGLSMPCGFDETGLPVGAQLIGPPLGRRTC